MKSCNSVFSNRVPVMHPICTHSCTPDNRMFTGLVPLVPQLRARTRNALMFINKNTNHISREAISVFTGTTGTNVVFMHLTGVQKRVQMGYTMGTYKNKEKKSNG